MADPFPFSAGQILTAAQLNSIGTWTTYTPSWFGSVTNPTIGNGQIGGSYARVNKIVVATGYIIMGSTTTYGSGTYTFGIPVTGLNQIDCRATCALLDASAGYIAYSGTGINATTTTIEFRAGNAQAAMSATVPITLGVNDQFRWYTVYEAL